MVLVEPIYCYLTNHFNGTSWTYILLLDVIFISPFLSPLVFTLPHSHCFPSPTSLFHILCLLVATFLSVIYFISINTITVSIFEVVIPIIVRLLIILSVPHILFLFPPFNRFLLLNIIFLFFISPPGCPDWILSTLVCRLPSFPFIKKIR